MDNEAQVSRRNFLRTVGAGSALGAGGLLGAFDTIAAAPAVRAVRAWDMSWVARITRAHRVVFDVRKIDDGTPLWQATSWMQGYAETENTTDADHNVVLVLRHESVRMALNDAMWTRLTEEAGAPAKRNPWLGDDAPASPTAAGMMPTLRKLMARGVIVLACNNALNGQTFTLTKKEGLSEAQAQSQLRASVGEGIYVVPNGVFGVSRAQSAGCTFFLAG